MLYHPHESKFSHLLWVTGSVFKIAFFGMALWWLARHVVWNLKSLGGIFDMKVWQNAPWAIFSLLSTGIQCLLKTLLQTL